MREISEPTKSVLIRFKEDMKKAGIKPEKIILFGSRARGEELKNSDYDVLNIHHLK